MKRKFTVRTGSFMKPGDKPVMPQPTKRSKSQIRASWMFDYAVNPNVAVKNAASSFRGFERGFSILLKSMRHAEAFSAAIERSI